MCGYDVLAGVSTHSHVRMPGRLSRGPLRGTWPLAALGEGVRYPERPELATVLQAVSTTRTGVSIPWPRGDGRQASFQRRLSQRTRHYRGD